MNLASHLPAPHLSSLPKVPAALAALVSHLPTWPPSRVFSGLGNRLAWPALRELDWGVAEGKHFCVRVSDLGLSLYFSVQPGGFRAERGPAADVTFTASAADFTRLGLRLEDPDTLFFNRRLRIEGDTNLGLAVKNQLDGIELEAVAAAMPDPFGGLVLGMRGLARVASTTLPRPRA